MRRIDPEDIQMRRPLLILVLLALLTSLMITSVSADETANKSDLLVMEVFANQQVVESELIKITDDEKHQILFFMGIALLSMLIATAVLGVMMGIYGKQVFLAHMIVAGLTVTLALGHSVVAIVWFFPF